MHSVKTLVSIASIISLLAGTGYADTCGPNNQNRKLGSSCRNQPSGQPYECSCNDRAIVSWSADDCNANANKCKVYCDSSSQTWKLYQNCGSNGDYCNYVGPNPTDFNCIAH